MIYKSKYKHSKYGNFMYNFLMKSTMFLKKHRWLYYVLNCTWGICLTIIGLIISLILLLFLNKPHKYGGIYYFSIGKFWGGFETGLMFVRDKNSSEHLSYHELGHTYQNAILGPFQIILITIPSIMRYWYRKLDPTASTVSDYDSVWFEASASDIGYNIMNTY